MKTIEKELQDFNFPEILIDLYKNRKTGTLTVNTADIVKKVYIEKGKTVFASSTDEDDRLGETLIKLGKITIDQYDRSVELLKETGKRQGTILVELGYLSPKDLVLGVKSQVREIIYSLFDVEYAEHEFDEGELPTREVITLQMSMGDLIYEGMKRINNVVRIKRDMPDMSAVLTLREDPENIFQDIMLNYRDQTMLTLIDGKKTVKELVDASPNGTFEAMKILYVLYITGMVKELKSIEESGKEGGFQDEVSHPLTNEVDAFEERVNELFSHLYQIGAHDLLGIDENADTIGVQRNYYRLIRDYHPDQSISSTDPLMLDKLIRISEAIQDAYLLLKDDDKRKDYFQGMQKRAQEEITNGHEEEHFRSELSRVNDEILSSREVSDQVEIGEKEDGESVYRVPTNEPPALEESTFDAQRDDVTAEKEEGITLHEADDESVMEEAQKMETASDTESDETASNTESAETPGILDHSNEETFEGEAAEREEEIFTGREESIETDTTSRWADNHTEEQKPEDAPVDIELGDMQLKDTELEDFESDDVKQESPIETVTDIEDKDEVQRKRRYDRFQVNEAGINGEMFFAEEVSLVDISMSGIALKVDRRLKLGREYLLHLHAKDKVISVQAEVVRSILCESKMDSAGNIIPLYFVGMEFKKLLRKEKDAIAEFINSHKIDDVKISTGHILNGTRLYARFHVDLPDKNVLELKTSYDVKVLSLCGMLIKSEQAISVNETVQMKMYLTETEMISFLGRTVACRAIQIDPERYEIAIEFMEMSEEDRETLKRFLHVIEGTQDSGIATDIRDSLDEESTEQLQMNEEDLDLNGTHEIHDEKGEESSEAPSQDSVNLQLLQLVEEIKLLLSQLRTELPVATAHNISIAEKPAEQEDAEEVCSVTSDDVAQLREDIPDHAHEAPQEEYGTIPEVVKVYITEHEDEHEQKMLPEEHKVEPQKIAPNKKKLKLWHMLIPVLFLVAATATFLFLYAPETQKTVSKPAQPVATKKEVLPFVKPPQAKESLPAAQKTPETRPVSTPEVKKTIAAAQAGSHTIELIALDSTWLSATIDENAPKEMILKPGDKIKWSARNNISLVIGNAAGLKIIFDGKELGLLGAKGKVVRLKLPSPKNS